METIETLQQQLAEEKAKTKKFFQAYCQAMNALNHTNLQLCWIRSKDFSEFDERMYHIDRDIRISLEKLAELMPENTDEFDDED